MKARVSKAIDRNNMEADIWMIMIQKQKGSPYNVGLLNDQNKPYYTHHKQEATDLCKSLNEKFIAKEKEEYSKLPLKEKVELEIKKCGYTWTFEAIQEAFEQFEGGWYVSHTAKQLVTKFYDEFKKENSK